MKMRNEKNPMSRYTDEDYAKMSIEDFEALLKNEYVRQKYARLAESNEPEPEPEFNSIEELDAYYHCIPFEDAVNNILKMCNSND